MRTARIMINDIFVGVLSQSDSHYEFVYDPTYLTSDGPAVSATLPKREEPYVADHLHPFFAGLVSEGSTRKIQSLVHRIDPDDLFGFLIATGRDLVGHVQVVT